MKKDQIDSSVNIINVNPIILPLDSDLKRSMPRPVELRQQGYSDNFDFNTLAYDVFLSEGKIIFSGPPSINLGLESYFYTDSFKIDGQNISLNDLNVELGDRVQYNSINYSKKDVTNIQWKIDDKEIQQDVNQDYLRIFKDKNVLLTKSKNNKLDWIRDWVVFYKKTHNIDVVILYNNNSDIYSIEEMRDFLLNQNLGVDIYLINWSFPFGPAGKDGLWDSDFCEYGIFEHAKRRFLKYANGVLNVDLDEYVFSVNDESIFLKLDQQAYVTFRGHWISPVLYDINKETSIKNLFYREKNTVECHYKWCISPTKINDAVQWKTHFIEGFTAVKDNNLYYYHYKAINTNWKLKNAANIISFDKNLHDFDNDLYEKISKIFDL